VTGVEGPRRFARRWGRWLLTLAAGGLLLYLFWPLVGELRAAAGLFARLHWGWLAAAAALQFGGYACLTALNWLLLRPFPAQIGFWRLMAVLSAMAFVEVALPSAGASGVLLRARLLGDRGYRPEVAAISLVLETVFEAAAKVAASLAGLWYLLSQGVLGVPQLAALGLAAVAGLLAAAGLRRWGRDRRRVRRRLLRLTVGWNRLAPRLRLRPQAPREASARLDQLYAGLAGLRRTPAWPLWLVSVSHVALDVASLGASFLAFGFAPRLATLLTGYGVTLALSGLAALPGGLGLAEASAAVVFARLGVPGAVAIAAALTYRLIAFWLLRAAGLASWYWLETQRTARSPDPTPL
jgi:uncharacterized membrane protein YbhN (UPF0104 family)